MTPSQKTISGKVAIASCLFFFMWYFGITREPKCYPETDIAYHTYCDAHRIICPFCLWWFIAAGICISGLIWSKKQHYNPHIKEEKKTYYYLEFCLIFMGNWLLDLYQKIKHPEIDCIELRFDQVLYTLGCLTWTFCGRFHPEKSLRVLRAIKTFFKIIPNAILYIVLLRFVRDIYRRINSKSKQ